MVLLKEFFESLNTENNQQTFFLKNYPVCQEITLEMLSLGISCFENTVDPDQLAFDEAI